MSMGIAETVIHQSREQLRQRGKLTEGTMNFIKTVRTVFEKNRKGQKTVNYQAGNGQCSI